MEKKEMSKKNNTWILSQKEFELLRNGNMCPKCKSLNITTFRHLYAKKWCKDCDYVLREEGCTKPYFYKNHTNVKVIVQGDKDE